MRKIADYIGDHRIYGLIVHFGFFMAFAECAEFIPVRGKMFKFTGRESQKVPGKSA